MELNPCFTSLIERYDIFLFDVYGIIHDGSHPIPSTLEILKNLHSLRKSVGLVSNSPLLRDVLREKLLKMGVPPHYQTILTAGTLTHTHLKLHQDPLHARLGPYCYFIGPASESELLFETPFSRVEFIDEANFILMTSLEECRQGINDYNEILEEAFKLGLPFICANPDLCQINQNQIELRAGTVAALYQAMGGQVISHGKPHREIFEEIFQKNPGLSPSRILLTGDSLLTDIQASNNLGFHSMLLAGPLACREMNLDLSLSFEKAVHHLEKFRYTPTYVTSDLRWD